MQRFHQQRFQDQRREVCVVSANFNGLPIMISIENIIVKIEPIIEGTNIIGRASLLFRDSKPDNAPITKSRIEI